VAISAEDELRLALRAELRDVVACDGLAATVIARYRRGRRRRVTGAAALGTVMVGIGVVLGVTGALGGPSPVQLHVSSYTLTLPDRYHLARPPEPISPASQQKVAAAAAADGRCVSMQLTAPFSPGATGDPNIRRGAPEVTVGPYHAWLIPGGCSTHIPLDRQHRLVIEMSAPHGQIQDLVIGASGLSPAALTALVARNLSS
jgi:hypothetical protein